MADLPDRAGEGHEAESCIPEGGKKGPGVDSRKLPGNEELEKSLNAILMKHGARDLLICLGNMLQKTEGAGNGYYIGMVIESLADVEW
jgi:hypothetical protein